MRKIYGCRPQISTIEYSIILLQPYFIVIYTEIMLKAPKKYEYYI